MGFRIVSSPFSVMPADKKIADDVSDVSEDMPELEDAADEQGDSKISRSEKKARKVVSKLGMTKVEGVSHVHIQKSKNAAFQVSKPDVYMSGNGTYIIFGEASMDNGAAQMQAMNAAAAQFKAPEAAAETSLPVVEELDGDEKVDESGVEEKDIDLMAQTSCSRQKAVVALKKNNNDIVDAVMSLSE